ncbi:S41 family peptidase [Carboxylicivirga sp. N1Y90]|uniref:S41 family peptidase n=1 Tax=Carboxylicivirga fragile TaxID=3417571 RepID=UPI003D349627|nr:peptidase S41 [Marinilabiliaceae bacterium N1Y90]
MTYYFRWAILLFALTTTISSCKDDDPAPKEPEDFVDEEIQTINKFVLDNMDFVYYWHDKMPDLDYRKEEDTFVMFDKLLAASYDSNLERNIDGWSFLTDDYPALLDYFSGVRKTMGHSIRLFRLYSDKNDLIGFIEYVEPNSPAEQAGLQRGDMFYKIDDQILSIDNYSSLLNKESYKLTLGSLNSDFSITAITPSINLTSVELTTNPIHLSKIIEHNGSKIGYLMYKSFIHDYNDQLETVFANFKNEGVDNLVLDLRYNGGGSVASAILLGSMIAPSSAEGEVFIRTAYNKNLEQYFTKEYPNDPDLFIDRIEKNTNNLNLDRLVVLSTYKTASASEMIIYGLSPHMTVHHIGEQTHGKYYGSITVNDQDKKHDWAIQPIVMRAENKDNSIDYTVGLLPDVERVDFLDAVEFYPLGDPKEDFLAQALLYLTGQSPIANQLKSKPLPFKPINQEYKLEHPLQFDMQYQLK